MPQSRYQPGTTVAGHYTVTGLLGRGGSSGVYRARDTVMNRTVAIKILDADALGSQRSFMTEARAAAVLSHPNIVNVHDILEIGNEKYIIMEYVCGITLREYIDHHGHLSVKESVNCAYQVLHALHAAHSRGIVHRDIKPGNILITTEGRIKVTDFGIARLPDRDSFLMPDRTVGTVHYVSPEQAGGGAVDERSDLYSLGVVLYEMLTGRRPFHAERPADVAMMHVTARPTPPSHYNPHIAHSLEKIVMCALEKDPAARFDSAAEMIRMLDKLPEEVLSGKAKPLRGEASAYRHIAERFDERTAPLPKIIQNRRNMPRKEAPKGKVELIEDRETVTEGDVRPTVGKPSPATPAPERKPPVIPEMPQRQGNPLDAFTAEDTVDIMLSPTGEERVTPPSKDAPITEPILFERRRDPLPPEESETVPPSETAAVADEGEAVTAAKKGKKKKEKRPSLFAEETKIYRAVALIGALVLTVILLVGIVRDILKDEPPEETTVAALAPTENLTEAPYAL